MTPHYWWFPLASGIWPVSLLTQVTHFTQISLQRLHDSACSLHVRDSQAQALAYTMLFDQPIYKRISNPWNTISLWSTTLLRNKPSLTFEVLPTDDEQCPVQNWKRLGCPQTPYRKVLPNSVRASQLACEQASKSQTIAQVPFHGAKLPL